MYKILILAIAAAGEMIGKNMIFQCKLSRKLFLANLAMKRFLPSKF